MSRERDLIPQKQHEREIILDVLSKAANDHVLVARLAENTQHFLREYNLMPEEIAALVRGDIEKIESWVGKLDDPLKTWINVKKAQTTGGCSLDLPVRGRKQHK